MSKTRFAQLLDELAALYDKPMSSTLKRLYWADLGERLPIEVIETAIAAHRRDPERGRFLPKPADVLAQVQRVSEVAADEAWALCLESFDEAATVCVTDVILEAREAARPVWQDGDKIGARVAFRAAYERLVQTRRLEGRPVRWQLSVGWDAEGRERAALAAVAAGRLSSSAVAGYLPGPVVTPEGAAIAGLLTGRPVDLPASTTATTRQRLAELRASLAGGSRESVPCAAARDRERFEAARVKALDDLQRLQQARGHGA